MTQPAPSLNDPEAERALLGAILAQPGAISELDIKPTDFYIEKHRLIFSAAKDIADDGHHPDPVAVSGRLGDKRLADIGGSEYLIKLVLDCPNSMNYLEYSNQVIKIARKREAIARASKLANLAANPDTAPSTIAEAFADQATAFTETIKTDKNEISDPWQPFTLLDAFEDRPRTQFVTDGIFTMPSLNIVYGPPGCLKSFLLADQAICVAAGLPWLPSAPWQTGKSISFATKQVPVMWVDFDMGENKTHERMAALARARNLPVDIPLYYYSMPLPWLDASKPGSTGMLALRAQNMGAKLIIIDNLGTVSGGVDENSGAMIQVMSNFRQLAQETGAAVILIHHQRKSNGLAGRAGDTLRGHSSIEASLDLGLQVDREADIVTIKSTKTRGVDVLPFSAAFTFEHQANGDLDTAIFYSLEVEDNISSKAIEREILSALQGETLNQINLAKTAKEKLPEVGMNRIKDMINRLENNKVIYSKSGTHNAKIYYVK